MQAVTLIISQLCRCWFCQNLSTPSSLVIVHSCQAVVKFTRFWSSWSHSVSPWDFSKIMRPFYEQQAQQFPFPNSQFFPEINGTVIEPPPPTILIMLDAFLLPASYCPLQFPSSSCHAMQFHAMNKPRCRSCKCIILAPLESLPIFRLIRILPLSHLHRSTLSFRTPPYLSHVTSAYSIFAWKCKIQRAMSSRKTRLLHIMC